MSTATSLRRPPRVLISGGSIAGPAIAWWFTRYGFHTTLVERWPGLRPGGQNIDVSNQGREIARRMSLEQPILDANTGEKGTVFTDLQGRARISMPLEPGSVSPTNETEILRGSFAQLLYDATSKTTDWRFGDQIKQVDEHEDRVDIVFQSGKQETFDIVVLADGVGSRTRKLVFPPQDIEFKKLGVYIAYFMYPRDPNDPLADQWVVTNLPGKRALSFRPGGPGLTSAFLMWCSPESQGYEKLPQADQIAAIREHLLHPSVPNSTITQRALQGLSATTEVYLEYTGQIHAKHLHTPTGRIGMIGDAAYCGTALSGAGTTLSLVGAYILAGELARHRDDPRAGMKAYEAWMAPFAAQLQDLPPGVPQIVLPQTELGIRVLHGIGRLMLWLSKFRVVQWAAGKVFVPGEVDRIPLPDYREYEVVLDEKK